MGAERAINYQKEDFVPVMREFGGANVILDIVSGDNISRNLRATATDAGIIHLAFNQGSNVTLNFMSIMLKRLIYTDSTLHRRPDAFKTAIAADFEKNRLPMVY